MFYVNWRHKGNKKLFFPRAERNPVTDLEAKTQVS